jgi:putative chitinase
MVTNIKIDNLKSLIPDSVISQISICEDRFKINSPIRLAHFLAQCSHESGGFKLTVENLNYSAERLLQVFPKYFSEASAKAYARNPEKIASRVYANRMGNGDEASKDGWKYRGRGFIQLTGKNNYAEFGKSIGVDVLSDPDKVSTEYHLLSAAWFWDKNKLNQLADKGDSDTIVDAITLTVNGGHNGFQDRVNQFRKLYKALK